MPKIISEIASLYNRDRRLSIFESLLRNRTVRPHLADEAMQRAAGVAAGLFAGLTPKTPAVEGTVPGSRYSGTVSILLSTSGS